VRAANETLFDNACYAMTEAQINAFPTLTFELPSADATAAKDTANNHDDDDFVGAPVRLAYTPQMYLKKTYACSEPGTVGLMMMQEEGFFIIGASLMQQYATTFDREKNRIGFARAKESCAVE
jgi:hypothetical protein